MSRRAAPQASAFRAELPDGSHIERNFRKGESGDPEPYGSWFWTAYDPDRRPARKRVNLRTKDKGAAMGKAIDHARRFAVGAFDPWKQAAPVGITVEAAVGPYVEAKLQAGRSVSTVLGDERMLNAFWKTLPAGTLAGHVEPEHVARFVRAPKPRPKAQKTGTGPPKSGATRQRYRVVLSHFFDWCIVRGYASHNPAAEVEGPQVRPNRRDHVSPPEAEAMLRALDAAEVTGGSVAWLRTWFVFGLGTGLRPGEQRALRWADLRLDEGTGDGAGPTVRVQGTKTAGSARSVPVAGAALQVLRRRVAERVTERPDEPVFTGGSGGPVALDYLSKRLQKLAAEAGVEKNVTGYSLRHSYGTRMAAAGVPLLDLARMMGTSAVMIERHYGHYDPARGASHVRRVFDAEALGVDWLEPPRLGVAVP